MTNQSLVSDGRWANCLAVAVSRCHGFEALLDDQLVRRIATCRIPPCAIASMSACSGVTPVAASDGAWSPLAWHFPAQAKAEYRVSVGDVLEVAVAGVPELRHRASVQMDGNISLPLVGLLQVAGLPLPEIRAKIAAAMTSKIFRQRTPDGREVIVVIDADGVTTNVAEYRPIYISGDVSKPGEYPYRPSITARQLVAVAGGYDVMRIRMNNPYLESADLRSEYGSLWTEFAKEQAHMWRIKTELGEATQISPSAVTDVPIARSAISEIVNAETEYLKTKQNDYQQDKAFLQRGVQQGDEEVRVLSEQQKREEEGFQSDLEELQKATDLFAKGNLTSPRVTDARRAVLLSSTQEATDLRATYAGQEAAGRTREKADKARRSAATRPTPRAARHEPKAEPNSREATERR